MNLQARMPAESNVRGGAGAGRRAGNGRAARTIADETMEDSQAEVNDVSAVLSTPAAAGESAGRLERPSLPEPLLQRKLDKERIEKEKAIKEKEIMQKKMDVMLDVCAMNLIKNFRSGVKQWQLCEMP